MAYYNSFQLIWHDNTGQHLFVCSEPQAHNAAMTLAIALQSTNSARFIKIVECGTTEKQTGDAGIWFKEIYRWGEIDSREED